jgi:DNA-cytosine methyltransferase
MNVLSLFDGMSCGQIALNKAGIKYDNYFASEIDKHAIKVTQHNYPNTIQLGSVIDVKAEDLPKIDLLIGGSPCQGFSFAGKQLNFEDERSKLFFEFVRLLKECKPKYFLLENVEMKKEFEDIISDYLGVEPIKINSSLLSAQNRPRIYWTNIVNELDIKDKNIFVNNILETGSSLKEKSQTILSTIYKENVKSMLKRGKYGLVVDEKYYLSEETIATQLKYAKNYQPTGKSACLTTELAHGTGKNVTPKNMIEIGKPYRKFTPLECERLQTVPDNYTKSVSDTQRYKMLGNGWTVDIIVEFFKNLDFPQKG